jgi:hypothetical protein
MANDIFSPDPVEPINEITLADLVGEDKKYKDPDDVAKAYAHAEGHIRTLERDLAALRAQKDLEANNPNNLLNPNPDPAQPDPADQPNPARSDPNEEKDFRSRIREEVQALSQERRASQNAENAAQKMIEFYGNVEKANEAIRTRAQELSVSTQWLRDAAARSPSAFYATMGIDLEATPSNRETPTPTSEVNLHRGDPKVRNFEYFDNIRKADPKLYFSAGVQREMMKEARAQGEAFYKR